MLLNNPGHAQTNETAELSGRAQVSLITAAPGNELYAVFGHTALRIKDPANNIDRTYNYGTFDFDIDGFYRKFALGHLQYFLSVNSFENAKKAYLNDGRSIIGQRLNLTANQVQRLFRYLKTNARPENRYYSYEFFYDNCTTRVYDAIKAVVGDSIRFQKPLNPEQKSFRQFINRFLQPVPWTKFGINLLLGLPADRIPSGPQTLFLPNLLKERFAVARIQQGDSSLALVAAQKIYTPSNPVIFTSLLVTPTVVFWLLLGLLVPLSFIFQNQRTFWRWLDRLLFGIVGLVGILIMFLWLFSAYPSTKWNVNILWMLPAPVLLYGCLNIGKNTSTRGRRLLAKIIVAVIITAALFFFLQQGIPAAVFPVVIFLIYRGWKRSPLNDTLFCKRLSAPKS